MSFIRDTAIDELTAYIERCLSDIQSRRNQLVFINRIPDDILSYIFECAGNGRPFDDALEKIPQLVVPLVCKRWRGVALDTPRLWTRIDRFTEPVSRLSILRSKQAPLNITYIKAYGRTTFVQFISLITPHIEHWGSLSILGAPSDDLAVLSSCPALRLRLLRIAVTFPSHMASDVPSTSPTLFAGHTPCLRDLTLERFYQPLTSSLYTGLTALHLSGVTYPREPGDGSAHQFLDNLRLCPALRTLFLARVEFLQSEVVSFPNPIFLPHARRVILSHLEASFVHLLLASARFSPNLVLMSMHTLDVDTPDDIFTASVDFETNFPRLSSTCYYTISFGFNPAIANRLLVEQVYHAIGHHLPLRNAKLLSIRGDQYISRNNPNTTSFASLLACLPSITTITLISIPASCLDALLITPASHLCPRLHTLRLKSVDVTKDTLLDLAISRTSFDDSLEGAARLTTVTLKRCGNLQAHNDLRAVVSEALGRLSIEVVWEEEQLMESGTSFE
ncbi:hypothetical protein BOTBODRAFT_183053 [Botryobasidium botryosum FD-172 SS1]|uniref:F-box domain-containing protein n=1 Tax=Botryobasidium botryosum (strain FD-172 SS1) TaxID=930990 RepID=A0A067NDJ6_BOTB1|nr:hypothetical protein BOTBODRAFT_183053 [Botryobasidium botryosum FD-172 SS1]